jgi:hypothetical protein
MPLPPLRHFLVLVILILSVAPAVAADLPGVWREFETGGWHTNAKEHPTASGGKRVSWFDQDGRAVFVRFDLDAPITNAVLFIRYSRALSSDSHFDVAFGPGDQPQAAKPLAKLAANRTGSWTKYRWISVPLGDLAAGSYHLTVACRERGGAGDLDVAAIVPDDPQSRWMPPNDVKDGELVGPGQTLDAPRPDDRMTEQDLAAIEAIKQQRSADAQAAASLRAHISDPANRLPIVTTWIGNDIALGPDVPAASGYTPHNVADIHVTTDGTLFTNVPWEEHGANVSQFKDGRWINDARVGNHGGGRSVTANDKYIYFIGNQHRTGKAGIDRRDRDDISRQSSNVHVDVEGIRAVVATPDRVFAAAAAEVRVFDVDLKPLGQWSLAGADKMAVDPAGNLWIILADQQKIVRYTQDGRPLPQSITLDDGVQPADLAFDARGRLLVADGGASEQVLIYDQLDSQPRLVERFGEAGGVYSGVAGRLGPKRFVRLVGVGSDAAGNVYVASRPSNNGSTILQSYAPGGELLWQKQCHVWLDCPDIDPQNPDVVYSSTARLRMDLSKPTSQNWAAEALTVHHRAFTDDFRHRMGGAGGTFLRRLNNGALYQYLTDMNGKTVHVYRFAPDRHGDIAIPAGFVEQGGIWVDRNGDGRRDAVDPAGMTYRLKLSGTYRNDTLTLELHATDAKGHSQSLRHDLPAGNRGTRVGLGIDAGGERKYRFSDFTFKAGDKQVASSFGSDAGRDGDGGFGVGGEHWTLESQALLAKGNRKGGKPASFTAWKSFDELAQQKDFEMAVTVTAPRGRLYSDRFGLVVFGIPDDWRSHVSAMVNVRGGYPTLELTRGTKDVLASKPLSEEVTGHQELATIGMIVDPDGAIWNATHGQGIYRYPIQGFSNDGVPVYTVESRERYDAPADMRDLRRIQHFPKHDGLLLVNGFTREHPNKNHHWKRAGKVIRAYENWAPAVPSDQWKLRWELVPPYEDKAGGNDGDGNIMLFDLAGDYLFVAREGQSSHLKVGRCHVDVYRADDASYVGWMEPTDDAGDVGIIDITQGMKAFHRADGEYLVFLEDGAKARTLIYRWRPDRPSP